MRAKQSGLVLIGGLLIISSCIRSSHPGVRDVEFRDEGIFWNCRGGEGAAELSFYQDGNYIFSLESDWSSEQGGNWRMELSDRLGRSAGYLNYFSDENVVAASGSSHSKFSKIATDQAGFLQVDGHFIGMQARDIPCILQGKVPNRWRLKITDVSISTDYAEYLVADDPADIDLRVNSGRGGSGDFCFTSSWGGFLGLFRRSVDACHFRRKPSKTEIKVGDNLLRISAIE